MDGLDGMIHATVIKNCGRLLFENARKAQRQVGEEEKRGNLEEEDQRSVKVGSWSATAGPANCPNSSHNMW